MALKQAMGEGQVAIAASLGPLACHEAENEILASWLTGRGFGLRMRDPEECPVCHAMHYLFVIVEGATTCAGCAPEERKR